MNDSQMAPDLWMEGRPQGFPDTVKWWPGEDRNPPGGSPRGLPVERVCSLYWKPIYGVIRRRWGKTEDEAKDLTQEFFSEVVLRGKLAGFSSERGSFRSYLKAAVMNFLRDRTEAARCIKRGGQAKVSFLSAMDRDLYEVLPDPDSLSPEDAFEQDWKHEVLARALELLETRLLEEGKGVQLEVFRRLLGENSGESHEQVGRDLGIRLSDVKNYLSRTRSLYRGTVLEVIREYLPDGASSMDEVRALFYA